MVAAYAFCQALIKKIIKDRVLAMANEVTYKSLLALFPFIIFLMTLLGFLRIDSDLLLAKFLPYLPDQVAAVFIAFVDEVIDTKKPALLSVSLLTAIYSASSGFKAVMRGINRAYGEEKKRGFIVETLLSIALVFVFAVILIMSLAVLIFSDVARMHFFANLSDFSWRIYESLIAIVVFFIIFAAIVLIYKASLNRGAPLRRIWPGAAVAAILWQAASAAFNIYVNGFASYSIVYGGIGGIFVLLIWLNILAFILLLGSEVNAVTTMRLSVADKKPTG